MADYPAPVVQSRQAPVNATLIVYALFAIAALAGIVGHGLLVGAPLFTILGIIGVIIAYASRGDARGTWLESHVNWLIRTFWWSTLWALVGWLVLILLAIVLIGFALGPLIWAVVAIWVIYRVIKGVMYFKDQRPIPGA